MRGRTSLVAAIHLLLNTAFKINLGIFLYGLLPFKILFKTLIIQ